MVSIASVEAFLTRSQITFRCRPCTKALSLKSDCLDAITRSWRRRTSKPRDRSFEVDARDVGMDTILTSSLRWRE